MADQKLTELTEASDLVADDLVYVVQDVDSAPVSRKVRLQDLLSSGLLRSTVLTLTDAQIKALPTTPITIVDGISDTIIVPVSLGVLLSNRGDYTNLNNPELRFSPDPYTAVPPFSSLSYFDTIDFLSSGEDFFGVLPPAEAGVSPVSGVKGEPFKVGIRNVVILGRLIAGSAAGTSTGSGSASVNANDALSNTGSGTGAVVDFSWSGGSYTVDAVSLPGSSYQNGDVLVFSGEIFGGATPENDLTFTVTNAASVGGNLTGGNAANELAIQVAYALLTYTEESSS